MTFVLLHGFTGAPRSWAAVRERLDGPALAPYLAGHGPEPAIVDGFGDEVARLCGIVERQAEPPVHLAGYSMGGRVALGMLAARPELFARATLIGARSGLAGAREREERARWEAGWIRLLEGDGLAAFLTAWEALPMWASQAAADPSALRDMREVRASHTAAGLAAALRSLGLAGMPDLAGALGGIPAPVVLLTGARDEKFTRLAEELASLVPRARRLTVAGAGHNLLLERPDAVAAALKREEV